MRQTLANQQLPGRAMLLWTVRIVVAGILLPSAYLKIVGSEDYVYIFQLLGADPVGRFLIAGLEMIAVVLLLYPPTSVQGALTGIMIMLGAIGTHLFVIGVQIRGDHGSMFALACFVLACFLSVLVLRDTSHVDV